MSSVTGRIKEIKQPYGGYIKPSILTITSLDDGIVLFEKENVHASIIGMAVDYLARLSLDNNRVNAFKISILGAKVADDFGRKDAYYEAMELLDGIHGIDDKSIVNACKLVSFDIWYRNPKAAFNTKGPRAINPDPATISNIQTLAARSISFFDEYGPVVKDGFTFEPETICKEDVKRWENNEIESLGGYTHTVDAGDGDFLTEDTLWDFKVSKSNPKSQHTLQLLMYWIMGQHSGQKIYKNITNLGIFNPRLNNVYLLDVKQIPKDVIETVEKDVICY